MPPPQLYALYRAKLDELLGSDLDESDPDHEVEPALEGPRKKKAALNFEDLERASLPGSPPC